PYTTLFRSGLVDRLRHVQRLREPRPVKPRDGVPNLKPGILDRNRQPMPRPGASEREQVPARLQPPQAFLGPLAARRESVPLLAHEAEAVGGIGDNGVYRIGRELR